MIPAQEQCRAELGMSAKDFYCSRRGVVVRDGKRYCKQHDPIAQNERRRVKREVEVAAKAAREERVAGHRLRADAVRLRLGLRSALDEYRGQLLVDLDDAERLADVLDELRAAAGRCVGVVVRSFWTGEVEDVRVVFPEGLAPGGEKVVVDAIAARVASVVMEALAKGGSMKKAERAT